MSKELNSYDLSRMWFDFCFDNPEKINPKHSAIYFFAIEHCNRLGWKRKFGLPSQMTMEAIGIKKHQTYIKAFNDLIEWGFFKLIQKSKNQYSSKYKDIMKPIEKRLDKLSSELCRLRHGGRCYICGHPGNDPHHIVSRNHKRQRWNQGNLVYLCRTCHLRAHAENLTFGRVLDRSVKVWSLPELQELEKSVKQQIKEGV